MWVRAKRPEFAAEADFPVKVASVTLLVLVILAAIIRERAIIVQAFIDVGPATLMLSAGSMLIGSRLLQSCVSTGRSASRAASKSAFRTERWRSLWRRAQRSSTILRWQSRRRSTAWSCSARLRRSGSSSMRGSGAGSAPAAAIASASISSTSTAQRASATARFRQRSQVRHPVAFKPRPVSKVDLSKYGNRGRDGCPLTECTLPDILCNQMGSSNRSCPDQAVVITERDFPAA